MAESPSRKQVLIADPTPGRLVLKELFTRLGHQVLAVEDADALTVEITRRTGSTWKVAAPPLDLLLVSARLINTEPALALAAFRDAGVGGGVIVVSDPSADRPRGVRPLGDRALLAEGVPLAELVFAATDLLFPHEGDQRRYGRVFGGFPVLYLPGTAGTKATWAKGEVFNISRQGVFIETSTPLAVGTPVRVKFLLPETRESIELRGEVARVNEPGRSGSPPGMGLKFTHVTHRDEDSLQRFVRHRRRGT